MFSLRIFISYVITIALVCECSRNMAFDRSWFLDNSVVSHDDWDVSDDTNKHHWDYGDNDIDIDFKDTKMNLENLTLSAKCERDFNRYQNELRKAIPIISEWALRMKDSDGKIGDGILDGHTTFEGNYPECAAVSEPNSPRISEPIRGKYCIGSWMTYLPPFINKPFVRRQGICIPDTCTIEDAEALLSEVYEPLKIDANPVTMHCVDTRPLDAEAIVSIVILSFFGLITLCATLYDWKLKKSAQTITKQCSDIQTKMSYCNGAFQSENNGETQMVSNISSESNETVKDVPIKLKEIVAPQTNTDEKAKISNNSYNVSISLHDVPSKPGLGVKCLLCFSLWKTIPALSSASSPKGSYKCFNGLRWLACTFIVLGHTFTMGPDGPNIPENVYGYLGDVINNWTSWRVLLFNIIVDTFFILGSFLVSISFLKRLQRSKGKLTFGGMALYYFNRYWRLTPVYMIILMIYTNLYHYFGQGPFMYDYIADVDSCSEVWWKNMLYINNFWSLGKAPGCMGWSWYLAVDMQLFIIAPLFIYVFYRHKLAGTIFTIFGYLGGVIANFVLHYKVYFPTEGKEVSEFRDIYVTTWTRCPTYFMGLLLGFLYLHTKGKVKMPKVVVFLGWIVALSMYIMVYYLPYLNVCSGINICGGWSDWGWIFWKSLRETMWGLWVCWVMWACLTGYGGFVNMFLSWRFFVPLARLSYLVYLIHPILCNLYFDRNPSQIFANIYDFTYLFFGNLTISHLLAFVLQATIGNPLADLAGLLLPKKF